MSETTFVEEVKVREGDVFRFSYSDAYRQKANGHDLHWCFDGQLIVQANGRLVDTYWGSPGVDGRQWATFADAERDGTLTFVCNLHDVDVVEEYITRAYAAEDVFNLTSHHGYRRKFAIRRGAIPVQALMLQRIDARIQEIQENAKCVARAAEFDVEWWTKERAKVEAGDISVKLSWRE